MTRTTGYQVLFVEAIGAHRGMHYYDFSLCRALAGQGVDVTLFTCDETTVPADLPFAVELAFQGIFGQAPAWSRGLRYGQALSRIARHRARNIPTIFHTHFFHIPPLDCAFLAWMRARGSRLIVTAHDVTPFDARNWSLAFVRLIYRLAHRIIVHTESSRTELLAKKLATPERIAVVPHGHYLPYVEDTPSRSQARLELALPPDVPVILFFGQIKKVKGLDVLLRALPYLAPAYPDVRLIIAGKLWKDDWSRYAALIDELELQQRLHLHLRRIPDDEVATFFAAADVVALPYRHVYQSGVLLMAMSYSCPVVATQVGGLAEVIRDGESGYLVPPGDPTALAEAIGRILDDPLAAQAMGLNGRVLVEERYSWPRIATLTRQVYKAALS